MRNLCVLTILELLYHVLDPGVVRKNSILLECFQEIVLVHEFFVLNFCILIDFVKLVVG